MPGPENEAQIRCFVDSNVWLYAFCEDKRMTQHQSVPIVEAKGRPMLHRVQSVR